MKKEELQKRMDGIKNRLQAIPKEVDELGERIKMLGEKIETNREEGDRLRKQRQTLLALGNGEEVKDVTQRIREIREAEELAVDEIKGLEDRIAELKAEEARLPQEEAEIRKAVIRLEIEPLVARYNALGKEMGEVLRPLLLLLWQLPLHDPNSVVAPSTFGHHWLGSLELIPKLFVNGTVPEKPESFFSQASLREEWARDREKRARME